MRLIYAGCIHKLYVLGSDRETYARDMFYCRKPREVIEEFVQEHDGVAAVMTRVGDVAPHTWGVTETRTWLPCDGGYTSATIYYFPGAQHAVQLLNGIFIPLRKTKNRAGSDRWVYGEWPDRFERPNTRPFSGEMIWIPNLR